jgi:hypothetical protein
MENVTNVEKILVLKIRLSRLFGQIGYFVGWGEN